MLLYILDETLDTMGIIDNFYSLSWAERYHDSGTFELEIPIIYEGSSLLGLGNYVTMSDSDRIMMIQEVKPSYEAESNKIVVNGESVESLLKRRWMWDELLFVSQPAGQIMNSMVIEHATDPGYSIRGMPLLTTPSEIVLGPHYITQFEGPMTIYDLVVKVAKASRLGFKTTKVGNVFLFEVYAGEDRSYSQTDNPYIIFSPTFDNVKTSSYYLSNKDVANVVLVMTDDATYPETWVAGRYENEPEPEYMERKEYVISININRDEDPENPLQNSDVLEIIRAKGREVIEQRSPISLFEGDFDVDGSFKYGTDFFLGDIVQCNLHNKNVSARLVELIRSYSAEGIVLNAAFDFNL